MGIKGESGRKKRKWNKWNFGSKIHQEHLGTFGNVIQISQVAEATAQWDHKSTFRALSADPNPFQPRSTRHWAATWIPLLHLIHHTTEFWMLLKQLSSNPGALCPPEGGTRLRWWGRAAQTLGHGLWLMQWRGNSGSVIAQLSFVLPRESNGTWRISLVPRLHWNKCIFWKPLWVPSQMFLLVLNSHQKPLKLWNSSIISTDSGVTFPCGPCSPGLDWPAHPPGVPLPGTLEDAMKKT